MTPQELGQKIVELCRQGKNQEAIDEFYSPNVVSIEAGGPPGMDRTMNGIQAIKAKNQWWVDNHQIHGAEVRGPFPQGNNGHQFTVYFKYDVTPKQSGKRMTMEEVGVYTVDKDKVAKEEFFYSMG